MNAKNVLDFYKELYFFEHERRHSLDNSVTGPASVLVLLIGGMLYYLQSLPSFDSGNSWSLGFYFTLGTVVVSLVATSVFLSLARMNYSYYFIPRVPAIDEYRLALLEHHTPNLDLAAQDFETFLIEHYKTASYQNTGNNHTKSGWLHHGMTTLAISIGLMAFSLVPFYLAT